MPAGSTTNSRLDGVNELQLLYDISKTLDQSVELSEVVGPIMNLISTHMNVLHVTLTLLNRQTGEISIEAASGLSLKDQRKGKYKPGEGITGQVAQSGKPVIVEHIANDARFLDKTGSGKKSAQDLSFICTPIKLGKEVIGTLSIHREFTNATSLENDVRLLSIVSNMIAQAVKLRQSMQEERQRLIEENQRLQDELKQRFHPDNIIGNSQSTQEVFDLMAQVMKSDATVLIRGESGTGKELVAHAIHHNSLRAGRPYIKVNCAALPETVLESELFGHEKGAFTGAMTMKKGRFELADGGTIFLDEIGDISPATQVRLLRVIQEREFERVGGTKTIKSNVRIIAATNRNLEELVNSNEFREDLYYRLNVFPIHIPPLSQRKSDILLLADHFIQKYSASNNKSVKRISTPAIDMMMAYHWPGNVRELENCIERAVLMTNDNVIHGHHLPPSLQTAEASGTASSSTLQEAIDNLEIEMIIEALKMARGNCALAAEQLGITERIMGLRLKKYDIDYRRFRKGLN